MATENCTKKNYSDIFIKSLSFWQHLTQYQKEMICDSTITKKYSKGDSLHSGEDNCMGIIFVKKGQLRTYMLSEDGREITLYRLYDNDICILSASCVLEAITFDVFVEATKDCEVVLINSKTFYKLVEENIYVEAFAYKLTTARFSSVMWAMQQILFMGVDKRLAIFLKEEINNSGIYKIKMTHEEIAKYIGTAREVVSRMLKYFSDENIVTLSRGAIDVIDNQKLFLLCK